MSYEEKVAMQAILRSIIMPVHNRGGSGEEVMVILENVCTGTIFALTKMYPQLDGRGGALADALGERLIERVVALEAKERARR